MFEKSHEGSSFRYTSPIDIPSCGSTGSGGSKRSRPSSPHPQLNSRYSNHSSVYSSDDNDLYANLNQAMTRFSTPVTQGYALLTPPDTETRLPPPVTSTDNWKVSKNDVCKSDFNNFEDISYSGYGEPIQKDVNCNQDTHENYVDVNDNHESRPSRRSGELVSPGAGEQDAYALLEGDETNPTFGPWFHGRINRDEAEKLLKLRGPGSWLVREKKQGTQKLCYKCT